MKASEGVLLSRTQRQEKLIAINAFIDVYKPRELTFVMSAFTDSWVLRKRAMSEERWGGQWL